jgi:hypothetical protein
MHRNPGAPLQVTNERGPELGIGRQPGIIRCSPLVNRTSVMPRCRTATEISRDISSSVSRTGPGSQSRPSAGMQ